MLQEAFTSSVIPRIPRCHELTLPTLACWWEANLQKFPQEHREKGAVNVADRIPSLPQETREALIRKFFKDKKDYEDQAMNDENRPCLIRVYLGHKGTLKRQDSLRNFPMNLTMMKDLGLEVFEVAAEMAIGLAVLHWQA